VKATKVNAGLAESNGRLRLGIWRDSLHVACGLTACTPRSAPGPTLGNEYGKTLSFTFFTYLPSELRHLSPGSGWDTDPRQGIAPGAARRAALPRRWHFNSRRVYVRSPHISGGRPAAGSQHADSLWSALLAAVSRGAN